jgi:quercetin dioxygenase-like cupin family protein
MWMTPTMPTGADVSEVGVHVVEGRSTRLGSQEMFTGAVYIDEITDRSIPSGIRVNAVRFSPGARTAWHSHARGQTLRVTEGLGRAQARGGEVITLRPGDTVYTPPGEWHWHGAGPDNFMIHLAIWEAPAEGAESEWGDHVTDEEYTS